MALEGKTDPCWEKGGNIYGMVGRAWAGQDDEVGLNFGGWMVFGNFSYVGVFYERTDGYFVKARPGSGLFPP